MTTPAQSAAQSVHEFQWPHDTPDPVAVSFAAFVLAAVAEAVENSDSRYVTAKALRQAGGSLAANVGEATE